MRKHFLFFLTFTSVLAGYSQPAFLNPYSSYGLGNQILSSDGIQGAMGGTSIAYTDSTVVTYLNSANIASLTKGYPLFSLDLNGSYTNFTEGDQTYSRGFAALNHLMFAVPFKNRYGIAFGLSPYARRGYNFQNQQTLGTDTVYYNYEGKGSISKGFVGLSYKIINQKAFQLSIGSNLGYLFGTTSNIRGSFFDGVEGIATQTDRLQSFHYDFSLSANYILKDTLNKFNRIQLNAYYDPSQRLTGRYTETLYRTESTTVLLSSTNTSITYISGASLRIGGNYTTQFQRSTNKNKTFTSQLLFTGEFNTTDFSSFRKDYNAQQVASYTGNYTRMSFGVQYTPDVEYYKSLRITGLLNKIKYRAGTYSGTLPYSHSGESFTEFGTTFGIGIPMVSSNAYSSVNLGIDLGRKSNGAVGALTENYVGFNIGIIIAPSRADYWFRKVKLD
jgi:hypothetical protein